MLWVTGLWCVDADFFGTEIPATVPARTLRTLIISALRSAGVLLTRIGANFLGSTNHRAHLDIHRRDDGDPCSGRNGDDRLNGLVTLNDVLCDLLDIAAYDVCDDRAVVARSAEHTSELQSLMRTPYAVFCLIQTY